ncbi:MAG: hypothetical protein ACYCXG_10375 [Acidiferrobacter sp.]
MDHSQRNGFLWYLGLMAVLVGVYFYLESTPWGRFLWVVLARPPGTWHL